MADTTNGKYANPDVLVTTEWVSAHLNDPDLRIIESNEDRLLYFSGHIKNAIHIDWATDLNDQIKRDYINKEQFEKLMSRFGITPETTLIFYGDKNNWWACYAFWVFQLFGHKNAKVMNGGRLKWQKEGREFTKEIPEFKPSDYKAQERYEREIRAMRDDVMIHIFNKRALIDVRSLEEYTGQRLHMPDYPNEGALRGGHIPGAKNVPWSTAVNAEDGTFKSAEELYDIYGRKLSLKLQDDIVTYCRIGERSSHTWFVLTYLLGYQKVRNYDGSWTEWGNLVNAPIEK